MAVTSSNLAPANGHVLEGDTEAVVVDFVDKRRVEVGLPRILLACHVRTHFHLSIRSNLAQNWNQFNRKRQHELQIEAETQIQSRIKKYRPVLTLV